MIETEKMAINSNNGSDGRFEARLLEKLQKAIGDVLSEHVRSIAGNTSSLQQTPLQAPVSEHNARAANGYRLPTEGAAGPLVALAANTDAHGGTAVPSRAEVANIVVDTIAEITRYPREILTPEARFDDDLGIDSLKRAEIVTAFLNRFGGPPSDLRTLGPMPLTVGEMADFAASYVGGSGALVPQHQLLPSESGASGPTVSSEPSVEPLLGVAVSRPAPDIESANQVTTEGDLKALTETVGILARRTDELASNLRDVRQRIESTAAWVAELKAAPHPAPAPSTDKLEAEMQALTSRLAGVEAELASRAGAQSSDRSGRFAAAAAALAAAVKPARPPSMPPADLPRTRSPD
jgi:acyl carrier protein